MVKYLLQIPREIIIHHLKCGCTVYKQDLWKLQGTKYKKAPFGAGPARTLYHLAAKHLHEFIPRLVAVDSRPVDDDEFARHMTRLDQHRMIRHIHREHAFAL